MPRSDRRGNYTATARRYATDERGRMLGSELAPHSITPDRLRLSNLAQLSEFLGIVKAGTFISGTIGAGRAIMGDLVGGYAMRDSDERTWLRFANNDQSARFGYDDGPGATIEGGYFRLHGDAIINGTIAAVKLIVGELAAGFLDADVILVGDGDPWDLDSCTGTVITRGFFGGRRLRDIKWQIDPQTGHFMSYLPDDAEDLTYLDIGAGSMVFSNEYGDLKGFNAAAEAFPARRAPGLHLTTWKRSAISGELTQYDLNLLGIQDSLYVINTFKAAGPTLHLTDSAGSEYVALSQVGLSLQDGMTGIGYKIGRQLTGTRYLDFYLDAPDVALRMGARDSVVIAAEAERFAVIGGYIALVKPWPKPAEIPEGYAFLWVDEETEDLHFSTTSRTGRIPLEVQ